MIKTRENTTGKLTIIMGPKKRKMTTITRELQEHNKGARHNFENIPNNQNDKQGNILEQYYETQTSLKIIAKPKEEHDTITEENNTLTDPGEYRAKYIEELYQEMDGTPEFKENTEIITQAVRGIEEQRKQKPNPPSIEIKEMRKAKESIRRGKSTGPDNIPNKAIIETNNETLNIYREYLNIIIRNSVIPASWQEGDNIKIYKLNGQIWHKYDQACILGGNVYYFSHFRKP